MREFKIRVDGKEYLVEVEEVGAGNTSPTPMPVTKAEPKKDKAEPPKTEVKTAKPEEKPAAAVSTDGEEIKAPLPGKILKINFAEGDAVNEGDTVLILEAMKMENEILADSSGKVKKVFVSINDMVETDDTLLIIG